MLVKLCYKNVNQNYEKLTNYRDLKLCSIKYRKCQNSYNFKFDNIITYYPTATDTIVRNRALLDTPECARF
jgi:hypothetical protein